MNSKVGVEDIFDKAVTPISEGFLCKEILNVIQHIACHQMLAIISFHIMLPIRDQGTVGGARVAVAHVLKEQP